MKGTLQGGLQGGLKGILFVVLFVFSSASVTAGVIGDLKDIEREAEDLRDAAIKCYVNLKVLKKSAWSKDSCLQYKAFDKQKGRKFKQELEEKGKEFTLYSKSSEATRKRIVRGLKYLVSTKEHMLTLKNIRRSIEQL